MGISALTRTARGLRLTLAGLALVSLGANAQAQGVQTVDPNQATGAENGAPPAADPAAQAPGADYATPVGGEAGTIPALPAETPPAPSP